jgi:[ribosomal protein S18]-alanine N-acetyltransferase
MTVTLRPMTRGDLAAVLSLEGALFGPEAWTEGMLRAELAGVPGGRCYLVAVEDTRVVGYAGLLAASGAEADVLTLAVAEDRWGEGIGATLLRELVAEATRRGCGEIFLEVRVDNARAQRLYRSHGFTGIGVRRGYYQPSGTDALVMRRVLEGAEGPPGARAAAPDARPARQAAGGAE